MGCSSSCRHRQQRLLHIHHRGQRARSASCGCRTEEGRTWIKNQREGGKYQDVTRKLQSISTYAEQVEPILSFKLLFGGFFFIVGYINKQTESTVQLQPIRSKDRSESCLQTKLMNLASAYSQTLIAITHRATLWFMPMISGV